MLPSSTPIAVTAPSFEKAIREPSGDQAQALIAQLRVQKGLVTC